VTSITITLFETYYFQSFLQVAQATIINWQFITTSFIVN